MDHVMAELLKARDRDEADDILAEHGCVEVYDPDENGSVAYVANPETRQAMGWEFPFTVAELFEVEWGEWLEQLIKKDTQ